MKFLDRKSMPPIIAIIFLFMILSRLTWMQVRHYPVEALGFLGPDFLSFKHLQNSEVRSWNINTIIVLFFLSAHAIRFISSSWISALFATTVLMSRGVVLARVGWMSLDLSLSMLVVGWLACIAHYLKTASPISRYASWVFLFAGTFLEPSFVVAGLLIAFYRLIIQVRSREQSGHEIPRGTLLTTLTVSFPQWVRSQRRPYFESIGELCAFLITLVCLVFVKEKLPPLAFQEGSSNGMLSFLDLHYLASLLLIALCALYGFWKPSHFLSFQKLFLAFLALWLSGAFLQSFLIPRPFHFQAILLWTEPLVLCLAAACGVFMLKEIKVLLIEGKRKRIQTKSYD